MEVRAESRVESRESRGTAPARRFEDLIAWQKARELTRAIYDATRDAPFQRDTDLVRQMRRSCVSIMANIAEGVERTGANELAHFLSVAKGSCAEVRSHLYVARDAGYLAEGAFERLSERADEVGRILSGLRAASMARRPEQ
jgi:four helix bundle protein